MELIIKNQNIVLNIKTQICLLLLHCFVEVKIVKNIHIIMFKANQKAFIALHINKKICELLVHFV